MKLALAGIAAVLLAQYLAGFLLLWSLKVDVRTASPLTVARYAYWYGGESAVRRRLEVCSGVGLVLVLLCACAALTPRRRSLHGDARFATRREILEAGLLDSEGIILGKLGGFLGFGGRLLMLPGQQGVALSAHPRAGKGVGVVIPNLLTWPGSVVCVDIKKENWTLTAGYRVSAGQRTHLFDPLLSIGFQG